MRRRAYIWLILPALLTWSLPAYADKPTPQLTPLPEVPELKSQVLRVFYRFVDEVGDTVRMTIFKDVVVYRALKFKNKKQEEFYWRSVRDVRETRPYAKLAFSTLSETYEYIQTIPDK